MTRIDSPALWHVITQTGLGFEHSWKTEVSTGMTHYKHFFHQEDESAQLCCIQPTIIILFHRRGTRIKDCGTVREGGKDKLYWNSPDTKIYFCPQFSSIVVQPAQPPRLASLIKRCVQRELTQISLVY